MDEIIFKPIGYIKSPYEDVHDMPKAPRESGDVVAEMIIDEEYLESMSSMEAGEEYMVLFYFHKSEGFKQRVPFRGDCPIKGLFSTVQSFGTVGHFGGINGCGGKNHLERYKAGNGCPNYGLKGQQPPRR